MDREPESGREAGPPALTAARGAARCRHFGVCGGCDWQDVPYEDQLERKRRQVADALAAALGRSMRVAPTLGTPPGPDGMPWGFRQKAAFVFTHEPGKRGVLALGHYARGSHRVVPIVECPVHGDPANRLARALCDHLSRAGIRAAGPRLDGLVRHVVIRTSADGNEAVVMVVVTRNDKSLRAPLRAFAAAERPTGLLVNVNARPGPLMVGGETIRVEGVGHVMERSLPFPFLVAPAAFFQTNVRAAGTLVDCVIGEADARAQAAGRTLRILDLYAGSGLFALPLAVRGHVVMAVEENRQAVRDGLANQRANHVAASRLRFVGARVEDALFRARPFAADLVVLDPPRQGCGTRVVRGVFRELAPDRAIYVSCDIGSLAAELPTILEAGYRITRIQPIDMFPHTTHVETVVTVER